MRTTKLTGLILKIAPYRELDRILYVLSNEFGFIKIVAKGVRKITSNRGYHLDLFNYVRMEIEQPARGTTRYLREISTIKSFPGLKQNPDSFAAACLIASFLWKVLPAESHEADILKITRRAFESLDNDGMPKNVLLQYFANATELLGYFQGPRTTASHGREPVVRGELRKTLLMIDPQFTVHAARTLSTFSS